MLSGVPKCWVSRLASLHVDGGACGAGGLRHAVAVRVCSDAVPHALASRGVQGMVMR